MAKTIFGTTEKSNFILNMDLDWYRRACTKLMLVMLWAVGISQGIHQLTYRSNAHFADMISEGGFGGVIALLLVSLRSIATVFAVAGVFAIIFLVIGLMRKQITKQSAVPYLMLAASLAWAVVSLCHSYDLTVSFFGEDGRDEGWMALLVYAALFYLGTMLRRTSQRESFLRGVMIFGIVQGVWGMLQAIFGVASQYVMIEPLLYQDMKLPSGLTDSPITYAMLLAMPLAVSVPAAMLAADTKTRILARICAGVSMLMVFKTQTIAGLTAGIGALVLAAVIFCRKRKDAVGKAWVMPVTVLAAAVCSFGWACVSPALNGTYHTATDEVLANGYALYDGGIVWDDGGYRLSTAGPYAYTADASFDINSAGSVWAYGQKQAMKAIAIDPLLGVGPDNFYFTQLRYSMSVTGNPNALDRPYNDYLYIAATRGIPSLLLHLVLLVLCAVYAWKRRKQAGGWTLTAAAGAVLLYALTAVTGISVLTVAPLFWMLLGVLASEPMEAVSAKH